MLNEIFLRLGLDKNATRIYLALLERGSMGGGALAKIVKIPRATIYDTLAVLANKGVVTQSKELGVKVWEAVPPIMLSRLIDEELHEWSKAKSRFLNLLPDLERRQSRDFISPNFHYYEGVDGIHQILREILLYRDITTDLMWPIKDMVEVIGADFLAELNRVRIRQKIFVRSIWPQHKLVDIKKNTFLGVGEEFQREIRQGPAGLDCSMGYWAYGNRVAFISSMQECFGFIVESIELRHMLKTQFEILWSMSSPIEVHPDHTKDFLKTL